MTSLPYCSSNIILYLVKSVNLYSAHLVVFWEPFWEPVTIARRNFVHGARWSVMTNVAIKSTVMHVVIIIRQELKGAFLNVKESILVVMAGIQYMDALNVV